MITVISAAGTLARGDDNQGDDKKTERRAPGPAEREVMGQWVGTWSGESTGDATDLLPRARHFRGVYTARWALDDQFVRGRNASDSGDAAALWMMTFDQRKKAYRLWFFDTNGASEWVGHWDRDTHTMTWETTDTETGSTARDRTRFIDKDHQEWHMEVKGKDGKVRKLEGKLSRKPPAAKD
jgi:hypothetical protein